MSNPSITLTLNASYKVTSQGAAVGLQAVLAVAGSAGPTTFFITQLSEQATKERARAIDDFVRPDTLNVFRSAQSNVDSLLHQKGVLGNFFRTITRKT